MDARLSWIKSMDLDILIQIRLIESKLNWIKYGLMLNDYIRILMDKDLFFC